MGGAKPKIRGSDKMVTTPGFCHFGTGLMPDAKDCDQKSRRSPRQPHRDVDNTTDRTEQNRQRISFSVLSDQQESPHRRQCKSPSGARCVQRTKKSQGGSERCKKAQTTVDRQWGG